MSSYTEMHKQQALTAKQVAAAANKKFEFTDSTFLNGSRSELIASILGESETYIKESLSKLVDQYKSCINYKNDFPYLIGKNPEKLANDDLKIIENTITSLRLASLKHSGEITR